MRWLGNVNLWIAGGVIGYLLLALGSSEEVPYHPLRFMGPAVHAFFISSYWFFKRRGRAFKVTFGRPAFVLIYISISLATGLGNELSLEHAHMLPALAVLLGFYIPFSALSLFLIHRYRLTFSDVYLMGVAASLTEGMLFGSALTSAVFSPLFFLAPFLLAYYGLVYGAVLAMPLVFLDERQLWSGTDNPLPLWRKLGYGFVIAFASYLCFAGWGFLLTDVSGILAGSN